MKEYSHGVLLDREGLRKRRSFLEKRTMAIIAAAVVVSMLVVSVLTVAHPTPPPQHKASISWSVNSIDSYGDVGQYSSLALDPSGNIEIMYYNASAGDWKIASYHGAGWNNQTIQATPDNDGLYDSLVTNKSGVKLGCCYDATTGDLMFGSSLGEYYAIDTFGDVGQWCSIDVQMVTDSIAISYYNTTTGDLKVAYNKSGKTPWVISTVATTNDVGQYSDMMIGGTNDSMVVDCYDATNGDYIQAWTWDLGGGLFSPWLAMAIDASGDVGKWNSQAGMSDGSWCSAWYDATSQNLVAAYWDAPTNGYTQWNPDTVGDVGQYTSIGVNSSRTMFISYYDATDGDLKLAWNESTTWYNVTLDSGGDVGRWISLRIDSADNIHISYYDVTNGNLKYIKVLSSEFPIPEFGEIVIPIVGAMAIVAIVTVRRNKEFV